MEKQFTGVVVLLLVALAWISVSTSAGSVEPHGFSKTSSRYAWVCRDKFCKKVDKVRGVQPNEDPLPMDVCKLNCGRGGTLWPLPTGKIEIGRGLLDFYPEDVEFVRVTAEKSVKAMLNQSIEIFRSYLVKMHPDSRYDANFVFPVHRSNRHRQSNRILIEISVVWPDVALRLGTDESYTLSLVTSDDGKTVRATIAGNTYFGARHALETLSHLIAYNQDTGTLTIVQQAIITDKPVYAYRGILMDTSRNFIPVPALKRLIDGLSYNKLNFFHWHITDSHSFPFESKSRPLMAEYGAYSRRQIYTIPQMQDLVQYARIRGVKILPEFDAPAHVGNGFEWGPTHGLGNLAVCINQEPWEDYCVEPPCGQLNPANENMYTLLGDLYKDFLDIFDKDLFHMGGDEVKFSCWNATDEITRWMIDTGHGVNKEDFVDVWGEFQDRAYEKLKQANQGKDLDAVLWTSELTNEKHIQQYISNSTYVIQVWSNGHDEAQIIPFLIKNGYRTIFSQVDPWYFDCGYGAWVGNATNNWCSPYKGWQQVYTNNPIKILANSTGEEYAQDAYRRGLLLGGEAALWTEQVDEQAMESKIWPRGSALAERLWTDPATGWYSAEPRMIHHRQRLVDRGLHPDALQPEWCHQNEDECFLNVDTGNP